MKHTGVRSTVVAAAAAAAIGMACAPQALADDDSAVTETTIGQSAELVDGNLVQSWTITDLTPSSDVIPYAPLGTLWEATATNEAVQGSIQPVVSNLNARAADGENYRVLFGVATPQGVNPAPLAQGETTSGKVYFDVTGATPDSVVYNAGGQDLAVWAPAPPAPAASGSWTPPATSGYQSAPAPESTAPAPATGSSGTPITEGTPTDEMPEAGSSGTPITEGTPVPPAPAEGSAGSPIVEAVPTTTEVPHGAQYAPAS